MKNFEKKEIDLDKLLNKLNNLNLSYTQFDNNSETLAKERDHIKLEKEAAKKEK